MHVSWVHMYTHIYVHFRYEAGRCHMPMLSFHLDLTNCFVPCVGPVSSKAAGLFGVCLKVSKACFPSPIS